MDIKEIERSIIKRYRKGLWARFIDGVKKYELIEDGDKIAVCISGGKDSFILAKLMQEIQRHGEKKFELCFIAMNPGYTQENLDKIRENAEILQIPIEIYDSNIFKVLDVIGESQCFLCARMRRGCLYEKARSLGCNKIALGHHFNDVIETALINMIYAGEYKTMLPKLKADNYEGMELIRPMYHVREEDIIKWAEYCELSFLQCACKFSKAVADNEKDSKRLEVKRLVQSLKEKNPDADKNIFNSLSNVNLDGLLGYKKNKTPRSFLDDYGE